MATLLDHTIRVGDLVLIQGEWTPDTKNAGRVVELDCCGWLGRPNLVKVRFRGAGEYVYNPASLTPIRK